MTTDTGGSTASSLNGRNNNLHATKITASASGTLQTLGINIQTAAGNCRLALYSWDNANDKPASLLAEKTSFALGSGWNDQAPGTLPSIVQGTNYGVAFQVDSGSCYVYSEDSNGPTRRSQASQSYGSFPSTWPSGSSQANVWAENVRMTYAPTVVAPTVTTQAADGIGLD